MASSAQLFSIRLQRLSRHAEHRETLTAVFHSLFTSQGFTRQRFSEIFVMGSENVTASVLLLPGCIVNAELACSERSQKWCHIAVWLAFLCV